MTTNYTFASSARQIFEGFYESNLFNSDMEYEFNNYEREEGEPEMEVDFKSFTLETSKAIAELLSEYVVNDDEFITRCEFKALDSPKYYNYSTDRLILDLDVDLDKLKDWALSESVKPEFNKYLKTRYTSYDGYISFVENNIDGYFEKSFEEYADVLIEFYMLTCIYEDIRVVEFAERYRETDYEYRKYEIANECFYNNLKEAE